VPTKAILGEQWRQDWGNVLYWSGALAASDHQPTHSSVSAFTTIQTTICAPDGDFDNRNLGLRDNHDGCPMMVQLHSHISADPVFEGKPRLHALRAWRD
jgi:hypothetical protein